MKSTALFRGAARAPLVSGCSRATSDDEGPSLTRALFRAWRLPIHPNSIAVVLMLAFSFLAPSPTSAQTPTPTPVDTAPKVAATVIVGDATVNRGDPLNVAVMIANDSTKTLSNVVVATLDKDLVPSTDATIDDPDPCRSDKPCALVGPDTMVVAKRFTIAGDAAYGERNVAFEVSFDWTAESGTQHSTRLMSSPAMVKVAKATEESRAAPKITMTVGLDDKSIEQGDSTTVTVTIGNE